MPCGGAGYGDDRGKWAFYSGDADRAGNVPRCMYLSYAPFPLLVLPEVRYMLCVIMPGTVPGFVSEADCGRLHAMLDLANNIPYSIL